MNFVSENIQRLIEANHMSISEFARVVGVDKSTISRWFSSEKAPRQDMVSKIAKAFNIPLDYFYDERSEKPVYELSAGQGRVNGAYATEYMDEEHDSEMDYSWCTICGDSMFPELKDGDKVKVLHQTETTPQDLTVVKIDGESCTVKYVEITDTGVWLRAINKAVFEDRFYTIREVMQLPVKIIGKVVEVRREY